MIWMCPIEHVLVQDVMCVYPVEHVMVQNMICVLNIYWCGSMSSMHRPHNCLCFM